MRKPHRNEDADVDEGVVDYEIDQNPLLLLPPAGTKAIRQALTVPSIITLDPELREMESNARFVEEDRRIMEQEMETWKKWNDRLNDVEDEPYDGPDHSEDTGPDDYYDDYDYDY